MLRVKIDEARGIAILSPDGPLSQADFESAAAVIDPYIEVAGQLKGLVICTEKFPGWDSFAALCAHLQFVKEHHRKIVRIALATDSRVGNFTETVVSHFVNAQIRVFPFQELENAGDWVAGMQKE